jgi:Mrp family chromosome partitioning ATPase
MRRLLEDCASRFDWVLIDAPSIARLPKSRDLARLARAALLVIRSRSTSYVDVDHAIGSLGRGCIIGTVLNLVPAE